MPLFPKALWVRPVKLYRRTQLLNIRLRLLAGDGYQNAFFVRFPSDCRESYPKLARQNNDAHFQFAYSAQTAIRWLEAYRLQRLTSQEIHIDEYHEASVHFGIAISVHGESSGIGLTNLNLNPDIPKLNPDITQRRCGPQDQTPQLTFKEIECLCWCKEGKTNWEIAELMSISEKTVEFHLSNTIRKLEVKNRLTAVVKGIQRGIIAM